MGCGGGHDDLLGRPPLFWARREGGGSCVAVICREKKEGSDVSMRHYQGSAKAVYRLEGDSHYLTLLPE